MKKTILFMSTLIISFTLTACTTNNSSEVAKQTNPVGTTTPATSEVSKTEQTTENIATTVAANELPPYLKDASLEEVINSKNNPNYQRDEEGEFLVYEDVDFLGIEEIH